MLKINKKVEYALMALKFMADKNDQSNLVSAREICDAFQTPFDTTATVKGIKGGYYLNKNLGEITYMDLIQMIEGREDLGRVCSNHKGTCDFLANCNISTPVENLNLKLNAFLKNLTLAELLQGTEFNRAKTLEVHA